MRQFNPHAKDEARAVQAWQILVGKAMNRQTLTYQNLGWLMYGKKAEGVHAHVLGHVAFYCRKNVLPPLNCIVVNQQGIPGAGIPLDPATVNEEREKVYAYDWYNVYPPSEEELAAAYLAHQNSN